MCVQMMIVCASALMCMSIYILLISLSVCTHGKGARQCFDVYINIHVKCECESVYT